MHTEQQAAVIDATATSHAASAHPGTAALVLERVNVHFGGVAALANVSLEVPPGQISAIVGPNGAGKSTLLNVVSRLVHIADGGTIRIFGDDVTTKPPAALAKLGVGRSFQHPPLIEDATVIENVLVGAHVNMGYSIFTQLVRPRAVRRREQALIASAMEALDFAGIADSARTKVASLPYGTRKLVDIVRAMLPEPRLLLLDEPTSGLDAQEQEAVGNLLLAWSATRVASVLMVEHHMDLVRRLAAQVFGLVAGELVQSGTAQDVLDSNEYRRRLLGASAAAPAPIPSNEDRR